MIRLLEPERRAILEAMGRLGEGGHTAISIAREAGLETEATRTLLRRMEFDSEEPILVQSAVDVAVGGQVIWFRTLAGAEAVDS